MDVFVLAALIVAAAAVVLVVAGAIRRRTRLPDRTAEIPPTTVKDGTAVVVLDLEDVDPDHQAVRRLVREAARRVLWAMPDVQVVEVRSATGMVLGRIEKSLPGPRPVVLPHHLVEPHTRRHPGADLVDHLAEEQLVSPLREHTAGIPRPEPMPPRPLVDRFDLPEQARELIRNPDDPLDLVRAILEAGGARTEVEGDLIRVGEEAVVVIGGSDARRLSAAYLRIRRSGAPRGLVLSIRPLSTAEIARRELLAPEIVHAGPDGIQRMADAVATGADPMRFAARLPFLAPR